MIGQNKIAQYERDNARAAAQILADPDAYPLAMVMVARICQRRQRDEAMTQRPRTEDRQRLASGAVSGDTRPDSERATTSALEQRQLPLQGVAHAAD